MNKNISTFTQMIDTYKERIYNTILEYTPTGEPKELNMEALRCYIDRKGQYRRPTFLLAWAQLYGLDPNTVILPAAIQQISEDYFLMHDDILDNNKLRRGKPAAHVLFGNEIAIIAGDMVHMILWKMVLDAQKKLNKSISKKYIEKFYDIMLVTHQGQYYDIKNSSSIDIKKFTPDDYFKSIHAKSAYYSVYGPMQCGAILAGANENELDKIKRYGTLCGNAFQIKDDILDCISTENTLGKSIGNDIQQGTRTLILWHAIHHASSIKANRIYDIYNKKSRDSKDIMKMITFFNELGSISYAQEIAQKLTSDALDIFNIVHSNMPENETKKIAREGIGQVTERKK